MAGPLWQKCTEAVEHSQLGLLPVLPRMTLSSFILLVQVSAKGTQMEREKSGLGLDGGKNPQNVNVFILKKPKIISNHLWVFVGSHTRTCTHAE